MLAYSLSMTSQWPPLSGPIRRIFPASFSWRIIFFMPERDKPTAFINSDMLILGLAAISWRIFRSLFRLLLWSLSCNASFSSLLSSLPTISFSLLYSLLFISGSFLKYFPPYFFVRLPVMLQIHCFCLNRQEIWRRGVDGV